MGAPVGNQNAAKAKRWAAAIERAIERRASGKPRPTDVSDFIAGIDMLADQFIANLSTDNDLGYYKEFGDRLDGKPRQQVEHMGEDGAPMKMQTVVNFVSGG